MALKYIWVPHIESKMITPNGLRVHQTVQHGLHEQLWCYTLLYKIHFEKLTLTLTNSAPKYSKAPDWDVITGGHHWAAVIFA